MGCVSSKHNRREIHREANLFHKNGGGLNHVVSLTSSTYGALKLDHNNYEAEEGAIITELPPPPTAKKQQISSSPPPREDQPAEVINTWELMEDLEDGSAPVSGNLPQPPPKKSPKGRVLLRGFADLDARSPLKFLNQIGSPRKARTFGGKENKVKRASDFSPRPALKPSNNAPSRNSCKAVLRLSYPPSKGSSPVVAKKTEAATILSSARKSFSPLFDPELVALYERELSEEEEQIKRIISPTPRSLKLKTRQDSAEAILKSFQQKCPPGGENSVVIYTTTLRGIRKTFEDCNSVRSIVDSHHIRVLERDVSMDSGFKEELRGLMGTKEVKVPLVFVKGRLIGGADQVVKLEEEGKLGILFDGIPQGVGGGCEGCAGVRFVMCMDCNGSCKVLDQTQQKMVKCGECNENGLIQCPVCC
ncbi:hypothetical protein Tsubulata_015055 [Turnera subulata]|uniref:Glutaredoxin domain-containing protein n=1 Tax=Turnera subulata TaxID=218843 RepID=A0A9Q0G083_9ROSI|nr:hypothetical protein Tsubulata_015055 [Turnera subulata]